MRLLKLTDEEVQSLIDLMDAGVKFRGLAAAGNAAVLLAKIQAAPVVEPDDGGEGPSGKPKK